MGRSGGSRNRSSGGSFGGNRSSGGRSGGSGRGGGLSSGGRTARRSSSGLGGGGFFIGPRISGGGFSNPRRPPVNRVPAKGNRKPVKSGCSSTILILIVVLILVFFVMNSLSSSGGGTSITKSTTKRTPLPAGSVNETPYYTDQLGWIKNQTKLLAGLKTFYQKTGVQPYLFITDTVNGSHYPSASDLDDFTHELYEKLFTDEAHLLLVFHEYDDQYMNRYVCGAQAKTVIDLEAADILLDYIDRYYYDSSLSEDEFFSKSFSEAASRIMEVTRPPWLTPLILLLILALLVIAYIWWNHNRTQSNLEAARMEELLKTPLDKFGETDVTELVKKYDIKDRKEDNIPE